MISVFERLIFLFFSLFQIDNDLVFDEDYQTLNGHELHSSSHQSDINKPSDNVHFLQKLIRPVRNAFLDFLWPSAESSSSTSAKTEEVTKERTRRDTESTRGS